MDLGPVYQMPWLMLDRCYSRFTDLLNTCNLFYKVYHDNVLQTEY